MSVRKVKSRWKLASFNLLVFLPQSLRNVTILSNSSIKRLRSKKNSIKILCFETILQIILVKMCLLVFNVNPNASENEFYLVLINVRDEIYNRPTKLASFWDEHPHVIGGMDLEPGKEGGTWLALSEKGKIGALLNILQPDEEILPNKKGRGFLAVDYVIGEKDCFKYLEDLSIEGESYNEFLLVTMDYSSLKVPKIACYTNSSTLPPIKLEPGTHSFGNSIQLDNPWPKVCKMKEMFSNVIKKYPSIANKTLLVEELFGMLHNRARYSLDENMKQQGKSKSLDFLNKLSAIFVDIPEANYGSRCHTVILIDGSGKVDYFEHSRPEQTQTAEDDQWYSNHHTFNLKH
ncbi:transport and Golgi organization protein 2 homolog [Trichonephila inaurata madagascariensis]|uniref:Transport and Golgi organization protein 2 homolog n=1 Tax=Trichonephila inaurata madagascariensis TaxID=2747483 RepID=A0A8X6MEV5_9ARAC|nr:transport and Golgi organization protein 2 homolog [Trichonephila inaurata madagascariensis]